jgi:stage II sporulation SpoE-like protein
MNRQPTLILVSIAAITAAEFSLPSDMTVLPLLVAVPALIGTVSGAPGRTVAAGALAFTAAAVTSIGDWPENSYVAAASLLGILGTTFFGWRSVRSFTRQARALENARAIAETVQRVLLRPVPRRVGAVRAEARYLAAAPGARVGGDFYDVVSTPFGVRVLLGDVMGKGLEAVETAADLLGAFRELAQHESGLAGVAARLDAVLTHRDRFATALLMTLDPEEDTVQVACCGHPAPLLLRDGQVTLLDTPAPAPPLGLFNLAEGWCEAIRVTVRSDDRLLLYTDGVTEARDRTGEFFPLPEQVTPCAQEDPETLLDTLETALRHHVGGPLHDDAALLLLQRGRSRPGHPIRRPSRHRTRTARPVG